MEDILDLYHEPYDPEYPVVCFDEMPYQMLEDVYEPLPMKEGKSKRVDYEYKRNGTCNLFMFFQPLRGWREVVVSERRTKADLAVCLKKLVDGWFPEAKQIRLVCDNLNTHNPSCLYENFEVSEARRMVQKLDFRYTPKHGSWLNMAEIELSVVSRQCLKQRIPAIEAVQTICSTWSEQRTQSKVSVSWSFSVEDARVKLLRLYPEVTPEETTVPEH